MTAIIIDDDSINTSLLESLLKTYAKDVKVLATANDVDSGLQLILQHQPDILFLDIEIHNKNARDILQIIDTKAIQVILITAYEQYAVEMYAYNVSSYLLKPLEITKLVAAVKKVAELKSKNAATINFDALDTKFISITDKDEIKLLEIEKIVHIEAHGNYVNIYCTGGQKHTTSKAIKDYEQHLPKEMFIRVHASHIVNWRYVAKYIKTRTGALEMIDGTQIPISAHKKNEITARILL